MHDMPIGLHCLSNDGLPLLKYQSPMVYFKEASVCLGQRIGDAFSLDTLFFVPIDSWRKKAARQESERWTPFVCLVLPIAAALSPSAEVNAVAALLFLVQKKWRGVRSTLFTCADGSNYLSMFHGKRFVYCVRACFSANVQHIPVSYSPSNQVRQKLRLCD